MTNKKYDIIIIGAGLGGLLCGNILSREGYRVCIVEQGRKIGGCIQSFAKDKTIFNTGLNYIECLGEGEVLNQYFKYFKIIDQLHKKRLDINGFNRISFVDHVEYPYAQGPDNFVDTLSGYFPKYKRALNQYITKLKEISEMFPMYTFNSQIDLSIPEKYLEQNTYQYIESLIPDYRLQQVLAGMNSLYGGVASKTPMYIHALINYSFIKSAWRLVDGGSHMASAISRVFKDNGGELFLSSKVKSIEGQNKKVNSIVLENGERLFTDKIISSAHPATTLKMVSDDLSKKNYKLRIISLPNTIGMFSVYIVFKRDMFPYLNYNIHHYNGESAWTAEYTKEQWPEHFFFYTPATSRSEQWADGAVLMTYMRYDEVMRWKDTFVEGRGSDYEEFKVRKAESLIASASKRIPNLKQAIANYYTSTPLTYRDYTGTPEGSSYGIMKDSNNPFSTIITPKSRIKDLYFTGQNLNLHGILGVTIGAVITCSEITGYDYLFEKIKRV
jgi:all-trans-retinol 13,14-reductase